MRSDSTTPAAFDTGLPILDDSHPNSSNVPTGLPCDSAAGVAEALGMHSDEVDACAPNVARLENVVALLGPNALDSIASGQAPSLPPRPTALQLLPEACDDSAAAAASAAATPTPATTPMSGTQDDAPSGSRGGRFRRFFVDIAKTPGVWVGSGWSKLLHRKVTAHVAQSEEQLELAASSQGKPRRVHLPSWFTWYKQGYRALLAPWGPDADTRGSVGNLSNSIVGAGILGLAAASSFVGIVPMLVLLVLSGYLCHLTAVMLVKVAVAERVQTYGDIAVVVLGMRGAHLVQALIAAGSAGTLVAYVVLTCDFTVKVGEELSGGESVSRAWGLVPVLLFMLPLSLKRDLNSLRVTSLISVTIVVGFLVMLVAKAIDFGDAHSTIKVATTPSLDWARMLPIAFFAFNCHSAVLPIFRSMDVQTHARFVVVSRNSFLTVGTMYAIAAMAGYTLYGATAQGNVLLNFPQDALTAVITGLFATTISFTYPLVCAALRISMFWMVNGPRDMSERQHRIYSAAIVLMSCVGVGITDVGVVFGVVGSVSSGFIAFIFPALFVLWSDKFKNTRREAMFCRGLIGFGLLSCVLGLIASLSAA